MQRYLWITTLLSHHYKHYHARNNEYQRLRGKLVLDIDIEAVLRSATGNNHTHCRGYQKCRYLGALDAMPGKQMAIDADLNSGIINEDEAKLRRAKIQRESPSLKIVVIRSMEGKIENSSGSLIYIVISRITSESAIFTTNSISVVQMLVVTKGAERVAEVTARFTLDAMPGKQMAIDAPNAFTICPA